MAKSKPRLQAALERHVISAQCMADTYKRAGMTYHCEYELGVVTGLKRAIEVANNIASRPARKGRASS